MWISSTEGSRWVKDGRFTEDSGTEIVIGTEKGKPIFGFGACFSELGMKAIASLSEEKRTAVYDELFGGTVAVFPSAVFPLARTILRRIGTATTRSTVTSAWITFPLTATASI